MGRPLIYWFRFEGEGFPVTMPGLPRTKHFRWRGLYGIQIGQWFIGAINGDAGTEYDPATRAEANQREDA
jgi:hypothetical protein